MVLSCENVLDIWTCICFVLLHLFTVLLHIVPQKYSHGIQSYYNVLRTTYFQMTSDPEIIGIEIISDGALWD